MDNAATTKKRDELVRKVENGIREEFDKFSKLRCRHAPDFFEILQCKITKRNPLRAKFGFFVYNYVKHEKESTAPIKKIQKNTSKTFSLLKRKFFSSKAKNGRQGSEIPERFFLSQFPFILEVIISIQYYHNQILDAKSGVNNRSAINDNLVKGNLLKDKLFRYIDHIELSPFHKRELIRTVRNIFELFDLGQYIEKNINTYSEFKKITARGDFELPFKDHIEPFIDKELLEEVIEYVRKTGQLNDAYIPFTRLYLYRIYLTNTTLFTLPVQLMTAFLGVTHAEKEKLMKFATLFGLMLQMVNDNIDFIPARFKEPTRAKFAGDAFSDLRNCNITLPLLIHLNRKPENVGEIVRFLKHQCKEEFYKKRHFNIEEERVFFQEILESHSIFYAMSVPKRIKEWSEKILDQKNPFTDYLMDLLELVENNRYYRYFYEREKRRFYKEYKKKKNQSQLI